MPTTVCLTTPSLDILRVIPRLLSLNASLLSVGFQVAGMHDAFEYARPSGLVGHLMKLKLSIPEGSCLGEFEIRNYSRVPWLYYVKGYREGF